MLFVDIQERNHHLRITVRDRKWTLQLFLSVIALLIAALCLAAASSNLGIISSEEGGTIVGGLLCAAMASAALYGLVAIWVNRSVVDLCRETITVSRGPCVYPGCRSLSIPTSVVEQIFVQEERFHGTMDDIPRPPAFTQYGIWAMLQSGERLCLLDLAALGFIQTTFHAASPIYEETAEAIERRVEDFLEIEDVPVPNRIVDRLVPAPPQPSGGGY